MGLLRAAKIDEILSEHSRKVAFIEKVSWHHWLTPTGAAGGVGGHPLFFICLRFSLGFLQPSIRMGRQKSNVKRLGAFVFFMALANYLHVSGLFFK